MGKLLKFGLIESAIIACVIPALIFKRNTIVGRLLLLAASILTGVFMAVFGQTYQTGADVFELFANWSVLILGWVIVSEFAALWVAWLVITNTAIILYWNQVGHPCYDLPLDLLFIVLGCINAVVLALREIGAQKKLVWLQGRWVRSLLVAAVLTALTVPVVTLITEFDMADEMSAIFGSLLWIAAAIGTFICFRRVLKDMIPLALLTMDCCFVFLMFVGKVLFNSCDSYNEWLFLVMAFIIIGVVSAAAVWLRKTAASMEREVEETT